MQYAVCIYCYGLIKDFILEKFFPNWVRLLKESITFVIGKGKNKEVGINKESFKQSPRFSCYIYIRILVLSNYNRQRDYKHYTKF